MFRLCSFATRPPQVLLDGINSAPPEELERLNSLLEDPAYLLCYEHAAGEELSAAKGTIHPDFRVFATSCPSRAGTHRLSDALLNRVIRCYLPPLDSQPTPALMLSELAHLAEAELGGVSAGGELAALMARFHIRVRELAREGHVALLHGPELHVRALKHAARAVAGAIRATSNKHSPPAARKADHTAVSAVVAALLHCYSSGLRDPVHKALLLQELGALLDDPQHTRLVFATLPDTTSAQQLPWEEGAGRVGAAMCVFERLLATLAWSCLVTGVGQGMDTTSAQQATDMVGLGSGCRRMHHARVRMLLCLIKLCCHHHSQ